MIKLLIFDVGGVIIDFKEEYYMRYISDKLGLDMNKLSKAMGPMMVQMDYGRITTKAVEDRISGRFHIPEIDLEWVAAYKKLSKLNRNVASLVGRLSKRYKVALLSNISISRYLESKRLFLDKIAYDRAFASCYIHMRKPERRIYVYALKEMNARPNETLFIDDKPENVEGARNAGLHAIWFTSYLQLERDLKKYGIRTG
jgi:HAD superfamily hydrolase (TIGR01509 family)